MAEEAEAAREEVSDEEDVMDAEEVIVTDEDVVVVMDEDVVDVEGQVRGTVATMSHKELTSKTRMLSLHYRIVSNPVRIRTQDKIQLCAIFWSFRFMFLMHTTLLS
jgi:hypothetical protein